MWLTACLLPRRRRYGAHLAACMLLVMVNSYSAQHHVGAICHACATSLKLHHACTRLMSLAEITWLRLSVTGSSFMHVVLCCSSAFYTTLLISLSWWW
jgi:hypothetical protein